MLILHTAKKIEDWLKRFIQEKIIICAMSHIYSCQYFNKEETDIPNERIYNGKVSEQTEILKRFESNMSSRTKILWSRISPAL